LKRYEPNSASILCFVDLMRCEIGSIVPEMQSMAAKRVKDIVLEEMRSGNSRTIAGNVGRTRTVRPDRSRSPMGLEVGAGAGSAASGSACAAPQEIEDSAASGSACAETKKDKKDVKKPTQKIMRPPGMPSFAPPGHKSHSETHKHWT
jgi:hypothetical protein